MMQNTVMRERIRTQMRKKMIALLTALSMVPALAACGSNNTSNNTSAAASAEAQTEETATETETESQEETKAEAPALTGTMKVDTGVKVELLSMSSGEVLSKLRAEGGTPSADLWFGGGIDAFMSAKDDGLLEQVTFDASAGLADEFKDSEGYWYSKGITIVGFLLNDGLMEELNLEAPASWDDLLKEEYAGEIIMSNPAVSGTNYAVVNALLQAKGEEGGWSYLEGLNKNIAYYAKRGSDPKNKVTTDEYAIGITYIDGTIESLLDEYDVSIVYPADGIPWVPEGVAAFKNAENGDAARYFIEWLFSNDDNLRMLAEIDQKNSVKTIKPSLEGLDLGYDTGMLMKEDLSLFGEKRTEILEHFEALMGDKAADE